MPEKPLAPSCPAMIAWPLAFELTTNVTSHDHGPGVLTTMDQVPRPVNR
jgi:hypothetical protein